MRIGLITGEYPPMKGGVGDYTQRIEREMLVAGHEVLILTTPPITNWNRAVFRTIPRWVADHQLDIINLQFQTAAFNMSGLIHFLPSWLKLPSLFRDSKSQRLSLFTGRGRGWGTPAFITTFHDLRFPYLFPKAGFLRPWIVRQLAKRSDGVIVTDPADEIELQKLGLPHLTRIPIGANLQPDGVMSANQRAEVRRAAGAADDDFLIAHFGFVNATKGIDTLLQAVALAKHLPIKVMMIGEKVGASDPTNYAYLQIIEKLANNLGIELHWTGYLDEADTQPYFAAADVVVLPFKDGASLRRGSLQAALAFGCCILTTTPQYPVPEFDDALYTVPADAPAVLADALRDLHAHPDRRQQLATNASRAAQHFQWDTITAQILDFYKQVH